MREIYIDWRVRGNCSRLSPEQYDRLFFPESGRSILKAAKFCKDCPVIQECLEYALLHKERGIWGGKNETERNEILKFRAKIQDKTGKTRVVLRKNFVFS